MGFLEWLKGEATRVKRAKRYGCPGVSAYYWDGAAPIGHGVGDVSATGAFVYTSERLYIGTILRMTLQQDSEQAAATDTPETMSVPCRVVRLDKDGVGVAFILYTAEHRRALEAFVRRALKPQGVTALKETEGQSLVEYALLLPLLFFLIVNAINFAGYMYAWIAVSNAARSGAQYAIMGGPSLGYPPTATGTQITSLINQDAFSLLDGSAPTINVCRNDNGTITAVLGTCTSIPLDPESGSYVSTSVDVSLTYKPLIPVFSFSKLGIALPGVFPTAGITIHRRAVMRSFI